MKLIIASNNQHKISEIKQILGNYFNEVYSLKEMGLDIEIEENGSTFYENAKIKAQTIFDITHENVLSDDTGLCVDALNGEPGIYSARYAGEECNSNKNIDKLLAKLKGVKNRNAHFVTEMVLLLSNGEEIRGTGITMGHITEQRIGDNGFGYDPVFYSDDLRKTFGVSTSDEKNSISHRGRALQDLEQNLKKKLKNQQ